MAVGVGHRHDPDIVVVNQPVRIGVRIVTVEEPAYEVDGKLGRHNFVGVNAGIIPEYGLGARDRAIGDMEGHQVVAVEPRLGLSAGLVDLAPRIAEVHLLGKAGVSRHLAVEKSLHALDGMIATVKGGLLGSRGSGCKRSQGFLQ